MKNKTTFKGILKFLFFVALGFGVAWLLFNSGILSRNGHNEDSIRQVLSGESPKVETHTQLVDSTTIYGMSDGFGMSTFVMEDSVGNTYEVMRMADDGTYGQIYGSLTEGQRYAMTTKQDGEVLDKLYNLTQLEQYVKEYKIVNGVLYLSNEGVWDEVEVKTLDENTFVAVGKNGTEYKY